jgi:hypothetical protein
VKQCDVAWVLFCRALLHSSITLFCVPVRDPSCGFRNIFTLVEFQIRAVGFGRSREQTDTDHLFYGPRLRSPAIGVPLEFSFFLFFLFLVHRKETKRKGKKMTVLFIWLCGL